MGMAGGNVGCIDAILHGQELIDKHSISAGGTQKARYFGLKAAQACSSGGQIVLLTLKVEHMRPWHPP